MTQGNHAGPDFSAPDLSSRPPDLSGAGPATGAPHSTPRQGWSQFDKPIVTRKPPLWVRLWPVALVLALVVVVGGAGWLLFNLGRLQRESQVGKCVELSGTNDNVKVAFVDCGRATFNWVVAKATESTKDCPSEGYDTVYYEYEDGRGGKREFSTLCLLPNFQEGLCYHELGPSAVNSFAAVECTSEEADFRVAAVHQKNLESLCEPDTEPWAYPEPARTFCLGEPR